jgi:hypothetical protein
MLPQPTPTRPQTGLLTLPSTGAFQGTVYYLNSEDLVQAFVAASNELIPHRQALTEQYASQLRERSDVEVTVATTRGTGALQLFVRAVQHRHRADYRLILWERKVPAHAVDAVQAAEA